MRASWGKWPNVTSSISLQQSSFGMQPDDHFQIKSCLKSYSTCLGM